VGLLQAGDQVDQSHLAAVEVMADVEKRLEVRFGETELPERQPGRRRRRITERIEVGLDVADGTVVVDETVNLRLFETVDQCGCRGSGAGENRNLPTQAKGEALKESPPSRIDGVGVFEPPTIIFLDQVGISAGRKGGGNHGWSSERRHRVADRWEVGPATVTRHTEKSGETQSTRAVATQGDFRKQGVDGQKSPLGR